MTEFILSIKEKHFAFLEKLNFKKISFFVFILILAFNPSEIGSITRLAMANAYLSVSVFVGITLFIFLYFERSKTYSLSNFFKKNTNFQVPISACLGAIPGCGGAIIIVTQYLQGNITFGCLVAVLTSTMGDAAFLLLAAEPFTGLFVWLSVLCLGSL